VRRTRLIEFWKNTRTPDETDLVAAFPNALIMATERKARTVRRTPSPRLWFCGVFVSDMNPNPITYKSLLKSEISAF
jgi:hypothetical protein